MKRLEKYRQYLNKLPLVAIIVTLFFLAYTTLGLVRHAHFGSFGADLGFTDRFVWGLKFFDLAEIHNSFTGHFDIILALIAQFYHLWSDVRVLIILQSLVVTTSAIPIYLFAKNKKLHPLVCYAILLSYLMFFGIQNALFFDMHSSAFGAAFLAWYIYFLDTKRVKLSLLAFLLTAISKENMAAYALLVSGVHFLATRNKLSLIYCGLSVFYLYLVFYVYFPSIHKTGYTYSSSQGLLSGNPLQMIDTAKKQNTLFYTFAWTGFLPLLAPLYALPLLGNLASYFILGREYEAAHEIFMHYRIDLAPLLFFATVMTIAKYKFLNTKYVALYLLACAIILQYFLHLPLSYLAKGWFWKTPESSVSIKRVISEIPENATLVAQNNLHPHVSQREKIELLWADRRTFTASTSPCGATDCPWLRWRGSGYTYLLVDLSPEWDARHLLQNHSEFVQAVEGMEKLGILKRVKEDGTTRLYTIEKTPK